MASDSQHSTAPHRRTTATAAERRPVCLCEHLCEFGLPGGAQLFTSEGSHVSTWRRAVGPTGQRARTGSERWVDGSMGSGCTLRLHEASEAPFRACHWPNYWWLLATGLCRCRCRCMLLTTTRYSPYLQGTTAGVECSLWAVVLQAHCGMSCNAPYTVGEKHPVQSSHSAVLALSHPSCTVGAFAHGILITSLLRHLQTTGATQWLLQQAPCG